VNKATMIEKIAELVREKRIEGVAEIRDESDRDGVRVVIELKREAVPDVVLNQLYRFTPAADELRRQHGGAERAGRPEQLALKDILSSFIAFREEVVTRRTKFLLNKARERAHVLVGLAIAVANIDEVIALIRSAPDPQTARERLRERHWPAQDIAPADPADRRPAPPDRADGTYRLSEEQARAILDLRLQRLTALGRDEIADELEKLAAEIRDYLDILGSRARIQTIIRDELAAIRDEFATPRGRRSSTGERTSRMRI
jgi:DNA gyrase subunit A